MSELPVVAAVANYNMATELTALLPQLLQQGYKDIFVLDDASTDNSRDVVQSFGSKVTLVAGTANKGAGGNRNRIIKALHYDALIHFLDADVRLDIKKAADVVRQVAPDSPFGFVVGLAKTPAGIQQAWNYGPRVGLRGDIAAQIQYQLEGLTVKNPKLAARIRHWLHYFLANHPDMLQPPVRREIYWGIEQNLVFRSDIFSQFDGFDESLRETEIMDLSIRMHQKGLPCYFDPRLVITHTEGKVRDYSRMPLKIRELLATSRRYGFRNWLLSTDRFPFRPSNK